MDMDPVIIGTDEVHPAALLFPEMEGGDFESLKESIREHGIRVPVVFHDNKLLDGRNRLRAYLALGLPRARLPWTGLPPNVDPYAYAWERNCERLDYTPSLKAKIKTEILAASGALERIATEAKAQADAARAVKQKGIPKAEKTERSPSRGGGRSRAKESHKSKAAQAVAAAAGVSPSTAERQLRKIEEPEEERPSGPARLDADRPLQSKRPKPERWGEPPHDVDGFAAYAAEHFDAIDLEFISKALSRAASEAA